MYGELPTLNKVWLVSRWLDCHRLQMQFCRLHRGAFVQLLLLWELYVLSVCCSRRHPACNAHASYSHLRPVRLYFPHISQTGRSRTKLFNINSLFWVSLQFLSEIFFILKRNEWDMIINVHRTSRYVPVFQERNWWNLAFLDRFSKNTQYQISWKSV